MSFSRPIQWYHSHADPIWPDSTFKFSNRVRRNTFGQTQDMIAGVFVPAISELRLFFKVFLSLENIIRPPKNVSVSYFSYFYGILKSSYLEKTTLVKYSNPVRKRNTFGLTQDGIAGAFVPAIASFFLSLENIVRGHLSLKELSYVFSCYINYSSSSGRQAFKLSTIAAAHRQEHLDFFLAYRTVYYFLSSTF